jgi:hypothetical protein
MATLFEYIEQLRTKHEIRIKLACPVTDEQIDKIEKHLEKYDAERITAPHKLILQKSPLDFPDLDSAEVQIIDFVAGLPVSNEVLKIEISKLLNCTERYVVVRHSTDPRETQDDIAKNSLNKQDKQAIIGTDYDKSEGSKTTADEVYGDKFNTGLLKELKKLSDERRKDLPKIADPDVPVSEPQIGDQPKENETSPLTKSGKPGKQPSFARK